MDSAEKRGDKNTSHNNHQGWDDAAFDWDNMKEGIFEKILEEEPQFFEEKRKRTPVWWWAGVAVLLIGGCCFWLNVEEENIVTEIPVTPAPLKDQSPIAEKKEASLPYKTITEISANTTPAQTSKTILTSEITAPLNEIANPVLSEKTNVSNYSIPLGNPSQKVPTQQRNDEIVPLNTSNPLTLKTLSSLPIKPINIHQLIPLVLNTWIVDSDPKTNEDQDSSEVKEKGHWKVAALGGSLLSVSKYSGSSEAAALRNDHTSPYFGYHYGVETWMPLNSKNYVMVGLNRQSIFQNIDYQNEVSFDTTLKDVHLNTTYNLVGGASTETFGDTTVTAVKKYGLVDYNEFKSVQLQLGYARVFQKEKWSVSPFINMAAGWLTQTRGGSINADSSIFKFNDNQPVTKRFQFSTQAGVAVERLLNDHFSLQFQYRLDQKWGNISQEDNLVIRPTFHYFSLGVVKKW